MTTSESPPRPPESVRTEWLHRVEAEYRSASVVQQLTLWLMQIGASPDLIELGLRIASDEMAHATMSFEVYAAAGGTRAPVLDRDTLGLQRTKGEPIEHDVTRTCVDVFCLGETVAVPLFKELRSRCTEPSARRALDRVLVDEVRHRDFGWTALPWLFELPIGQTLRALAVRELPSYFARLHRTYGAPSLKKRDAATDIERAWGLMPPALYPDILERTMERDWAPRFDEVGIDARAAWAAAKARLGV